jgi:hypothetical protein
MSELDRSTRAVIDAAAPHEKPSSLHRARAREAFAKRVGAGVFTATTAAGALQAATAATAAAGSGVAAGSPILAKALIVLALAGVAGGGGLAIHRASSNAKVPAAVVASAPPPIEIRPQVDPPHVDPPIQATAAAQVPTATPRSKPNVAAPSAQRADGPPVHDFDGELAIIGEAQSALSAGDPARALRLADEHAARFPNGQFSAERAGIRALASCALHAPDAQAQATRFLRTQPGSPLAGRVRKACGIK